MMASLFLIFTVAIFLAMFGQRKASLYLALGNLVLCLWMLSYHATTVLDIRL